MEKKGTVRMFDKMQMFQVPFQRFCENDEKRQKLN